MSCGRRRVGLTHVEACSNESHCYEPDVPWSSGGQRLLFPSVRKALNRLLSAARQYADLHQDRCGDRQFSELHTAGFGEDLGAEASFP